MNIEERVDKIEKRVDSGENRTKLIEQAILQMKDLVIRHEERLDNHNERLDSHDDFSKSIRESREDFNFKLNAVIDLQLENEVGLRKLKASSEKEWGAVKELRRASESQLTRIEKLESE